MSNWENTQLLKNGIDMGASVVQTTRKYVEKAPYVGDAATEMNGRIEKAVGPYMEKAAPYVERADKELSMRLGQVERNLKPAEKLEAMVTKVDSLVDTYMPANEPVEEEKKLKYSDKATFRSVMTKVQVRTSERLDDYLIRNKLKTKGGPVIVSAYVKTAKASGMKLLEQAIAFFWTYITFTILTTAFLVSLLAERVFPAIASRMPKKESPVADAKVTLNAAVKEMSGAVNEMAGKTKKIASDVTPGNTIDANLKSKAE